MRLELEQNHTQAAYTETDARSEDKAAQAAQHLKDGIRAAQSGDRSAARTSLLRAAELDPRSESAWLWLSSISEYPEELLAFLTNVLEINPLNARALEWSAATKALLAKNFVQRGIDAAESGQSDMAAQHFNQALEYDEQNSMAWLWLASLCTSSEGKLSYFEKVLEFDPENESANAGYAAARNSIREGLLAEARTAAVAGNTATANEFLDAIIAEEPNAEDAWVLRSHLAVDFDTKVSAYKRILEINPENAGAKAGLDSISFILSAVAQNEPAAESSGESAVHETAENEMQTAAADEPAAAHEPEVPTYSEMTLHPIGSEPVSTEDAYAPVSPFQSYAEDMTEDLPANSFIGENSIFDESGVMVVDEPAAFDESPENPEPAYDFHTLPEPEQDSAEHARSFDEVPEPAPSYIRFDTSEEADEQPRNVEELTFELAEIQNETAEWSNGADNSPSAFEELMSEQLAVENPAEPFEPGISAPSTNPFESDEFRNEPDPFRTLISIDMDPATLAAVQNYDPAPTRVTSELNGSFDAPFDMARFSGTIPMPDVDLTEPETRTGYETRINTPSEPARPPAAASCSYCGFENDAQAISCHGCLAVLTLADLELILANHHADKSILRKSVEDMERERSSREFSEAELTTLGIGHLNLRNLQYGFNYLQEASQKNPNNVVLSGQVNALLIRLDEIKRQDENHEAMTKGKTILVVDDSPTVRKLIAGKLEKCGHDVHCSSDGVEAMERLAELKPDLVLLDITMPRMDGYQVCKLIRGNEEMKDVPVVMISGKDGFFDKVRGRMAGTSGYITKPFGPETLMKTVEAYLRGEEHQD